MSQIWQKKGQQNLRVGVSRKKGDVIELCIEGSEECGACV